jgi:hypothetical protein
VQAQRASAACKRSVQAQRASAACKRSVQAQRASAACKRSVQAQRCAATPFYYCFFFLYSCLLTICDFLLLKITNGFTFANALAKVLTNVRPFFLKNYVKFMFNQ